MAQTTQRRDFEAIENDAQRAFVLQRDAQRRDPYPSVQERKESLSRLERVLVENVDAIADAVNADFGHRPAEETLLLEILPSVEGIRYARRRVARWMRPQRRHVSMLFATGKNRVIPQPKGVTGIIVPWNYPIFLTFGPLTSALAAGNRCMIKMAGRSHRLRELLQEKLLEQFPPERVALLPGVRGADFSTLPFDHMLFTGSADSGRSVMRAAAENLTPVTLELGGKSPTVVCEDFDIETAASRILYAKFLNAGQTCLAPDYVLLPERSRDAFVEAAQRIVPARYPDPSGPSYTSIIDEKSYSRLRAALEDARSRGASVVPLVPGADADNASRKLPPQLVLDVDDTMQIMQEEIFGPLLPIKTYRRLDDVIAYINSRDRPLALYVFTKDRNARRRLIYGTLSGGVTVNNCMLHVAQHDMPFGGIGASGMGHYHAYEGFAELSKLRTVFTQPRLSLLDKLYPPYGPLHRKVFDILLRFMR